VAHTLKGAALIPASLQQLADEAFADLLAKHHRPRTFKDALKLSARTIPANENKPRRRK
jgi:hypothetical protein